MGEPVAIGPMDAETIARFWTRVDKRSADECWNYLGTTADRGYGQFTVSRKTRRAHRVAYEIVVGPIPAGMQLDHLCRNRSCVNPDHLEPVTNRQNWERGMAPSAVAVRKEDCSKGHRDWYITKKGGRICRVCRRLWIKEDRRRKRLLRAETSTPQEPHDENCWIACPHTEPPSTPQEPRCDSLFPGGHGESRTCVLSKGHSAAHVYSSTPQEPR